MGGSFPAALAPCCLRFLRPIRVVGWGGGSYLGLSFCWWVRDGSHRVEKDLAFLSLSSRPAPPPGGPPPIPDCWLPLDKLVHASIAIVSERTIFSLV